MVRDSRGVTRGGDGRRGGWPAAAIEGVPRSRPRPAVADSPSRVCAPHACRRFGAARTAPRRRAPRPTVTPPSALSVPRAAVAAQIESRRATRAERGFTRTSEVQGAKRGSSAHSASTAAGAGREPARSRVGARKACGEGYRCGSMSGRENGSDHRSWRCTSFLWSACVVSRLNRPLGTSMILY